MFSSPFFRRLFLSYLMLIGASCVAVGIYGATRLRDSYLQRTEMALETDNRLIEQAIAEPLAAGQRADVAGILQRMSQQADCRLTLVGADGTVIADTQGEAATMDNHRTRPEIVDAARRGQGTSIRHSDTLGRDMLYLARQVNVTPRVGQRQPAGNEVYFLRVAMPLPQVDRDIRALYVGVSLMVLMAFAVAGLLSYNFAGRQAEPLRQVAHFAADLAQGRLQERRLPLGTGRKSELTTLSGALESLADSIVALLSKAREDNSRLMTILASMSEGVVAADRQQRILLTNKAAGALLGFDEVAATGRLLWEVVRNDAVLKAAGEVLAAGQRKTFGLGPVSGRHLEITVCTFPTEDKPEGLILVAHDVTQSVQYQDLRREFVANVSHELRTPLSIIKGFAETLRDGAISDPQRGPQYLATIEKHTDQLTNLVDDLLALSRLESPYGAGRRSPVDVGALIGRACDLLVPVAQRKHHQLVRDVADGLPELMGAADYIERAIANLIDNAIKYTPEGGVIRVHAIAQDGEVVIEVIDNGIGISQQDLPRIFERFYRVDRSRSRDLGGTGLGLSIVKHVAQAHGGTVEVSSTPGSGSTFRLRLPISK